MAFSLGGDDLVAVVVITISDGNDLRSKDCARASGGMSSFSRFPSVDDDGDER